MRTFRFLSLAILCGLSLGCLAQAQNHQPSPRVVAQISKTNLTGNQAQRNLFTPQQDGLFRLSIYVGSTAGPGVNEIEFQGTYVDDAGRETYGVTLGGQVGACGGVCGWTFVLKANAGKPITWEINLHPDTGDTTHSAYATLEKLQPLQ
jgi:hypothetical protein